MELCHYLRLEKICKQIAKFFKLQGVKSGLINLPYLTTNKKKGKTQNFK